MKERPILFSTPMVQAILDRRKSQTRRIIKPQPSKQWAVEKWAKDGPGSVSVSDLTAADREMYDIHSNCHYGQPGDRLWVKETFYAYGKWITQDGKWKFVDLTPKGKYHYIDNPPTGIVRHRLGERLGWYKRPSLFMPRHASRITLEVKDIRLERLQDISEEDAKAEGAPMLKPLNGKDWQGPYHFGFHRLWSEIYGPNSWIANDWVTVVGFELIKQKF